jgi:hypothetical protein
MSTRPRLNTWASSLLVAGACALGALVVPLAGATAETGPDATPPATVMAFRATGHDLVFRVPTGGCTAAEDFRVGIERSGSSVALTLERQTPDHCKGWFPAGIEISIPYEDVGLQSGDRIRLTNTVDPQRPSAQ